MSGPLLPIHFSPGIATRLEPHLPWWANAVRDWHCHGDPDAIFGRDVCNHPDGYTATWARHTHVVPSSQGFERERWEKASTSYRRTSDRLLVYSMDSEYPFKYEVLLLALLGDPGGHARLIKGAQAQEARAIWDNLAYAHQTSGDLPNGTTTES